MSVKPIEQWADEEADDLLKDLLTHIDNIDPVMDEDTLRRMMAISIREWHDAKIKKTWPLVPEKWASSEYTIQMPDRNNISISRASTVNDTWKVRRAGMCLMADGTWEYEPTNSERTEEWLAKARFTHDDALRRAVVAAKNT